MKGNDKMMLPTSILMNTLSRFKKRTTYNNIDFLVTKYRLLNFETTNKDYHSIYLFLGPNVYIRSKFVHIKQCKKWLRSDHKQTCYLTQKCDTHQIRIRIARGHFQGLIFARLSFRKGSLSVI